MQHGGFLRNVLTMSGGAILAQVIPIAASPFLARLYAPSDFGVLTTVVALTALVSFISTGRYELAILLPENDREAWSVGTLALFLTLSVAALAALAATAAIVWANHLEIVHQLGLLIYCIPAFGCLLAIGQIANAFAHRQSNYRLMAAANVWQQIAAALSALALGFFHISGLGLLVGRFAGLLTFSAVFLPGLATKWPKSRLNLRLPDLQRVARTYRQFPAYNLPYALIASFSRDFLIFAFTWFSQIGAAGLFGLTRMVLTAPIYLLSGSISQVFYREAVDNGDTPAFRQLTYRLMITVAITTIPTFMLLAWWAPDVFALVFGERWRQAGHFAAPLTLPTALFAITCWPGRIFEAHDKQYQLLIVQSVFDLLAITVIVALLARNASPVAAVQAYAAVQVLFHLSYLWLIFRLCQLTPKQFAMLLALIATLATSAFAAGNAIGLLGLEPLAMFCTHALLVTVISLSALALVLRFWNLITAASLQSTAKEQAIT